MKAYVGQVRFKDRSSSSGRRATRLDDWGIGECTCRGELPPRRRPFFYDNGAFRDWTAGKPFDAARFLADIDRMREAGLDPDFVVAPDLVGGGLRSLEVSLGWADSLAGFRVYLAVQDGMEPAHVAPHLDRFDGVFVGGTLDWKLRTSMAWVDFAHSNSKPCHIGRVGKPRLVEWAHAIGADSIDSSEPLWSNEKLEAFAGALRSKQARMW